MDTALQQRAPARFEALAAEGRLASRAPTDNVKPVVVGVSSLLWMGFATVGLSFWAIFEQ